MGLIIPDLKGGYNKFGGGYMSDGKGNATKIGGMYYADGKGNAIKIYSGFIPEGISLYDFNGQRIGLTGSQILPSGTSPKYRFTTIQGSSITLTKSIKECPHGISVAFEKTSAIYLDQYSISSDMYSNLSFQNNPINISKNSLNTSCNVSDGGGSNFSIKISVSGKDLSFTTDGEGGTMYGHFSDLQPGHLIAIKSIVSY